MLHEPTIGGVPSYVCWFVLVKNTHQLHGEFLSHRGTRNHPNLDYFSIETNNLGATPHFRKPPYTYICIYIIIYIIIIYIYIHTYTAIIYIHTYTVIIYIHMYIYIHYIFTGVPLEISRELNLGALSPSFLWLLKGQTMLTRRKPDPGSKKHLCFSFLIIFHTYFSLYIIRL